MELSLLHLEGVELHIRGRGRIGNTWPQVVVAGHIEDQQDSKDTVDSQAEARMQLTPR